MFLLGTGLVVVVLAAKTEQVTAALDLQTAEDRVHALRQKKLKYENRLKMSFSSIVPMQVI